MSRDTHADQSFVAALERVRNDGTCRHGVQIGFCLACAGEAVSHPPGEWTREPPTVAGWYWLRNRNSGKDLRARYLIVVPNHRYIATERWSIPIPPPGSGT